MIPPEWVTEAIEEIAPQARLAWTGVPVDPAIHYKDSVWDFLLPQAIMEEEDKQDVGSFFVLQLYHRRDAVETVRVQWAGAGPIYGSRFDPLERVPIILMPLTKTCVFNGSAIKVVRDMIKPWKVWAIETAKESDAAYKREREDQYAEAGDRLWHQANQTDSGHTVIARKHISTEDKAKAAGDVPPSPLDTYTQDMLK